MSLNDQASSVLDRVTIRASNPTRGLVVYQAITGAAFEKSVSGPVVFSVRLGDATLVVDGISETAEHSGPTGISSIGLSIDDLDACAQRLGAAGALFSVGEGDRTISVDRQWSNGVAVSLRSISDDDGPDRAAEAALDHVAILVGDLEAAAKRWEVILGHPPDHLGVHPLGTSVAARFIVGDRMVELVAARPDDAESPLRLRHERVGDGPLALALVANDLDRTVEAVEATGARIISQPPHLLVHPADAAGALIQLTPRVHS